MSHLKDFSIYEWITCESILNNVSGAIKALVSQAAKSSLTVITTGERWQSYPTYKNSFCLVILLL